MMSIIDDFAIEPRPLSDETRDAADRQHQLEIHVDRSAGKLVVTPVGEIDIVTGGLFLEALIAAVSAGEARLVVDLTRVPFMDSTGLAIFLSAHRALRSVDGQLRIVAGPQIAEMFEFAWMDKFFPLHADVESAIAGFTRTEQMGSPPCVSATLDVGQPPLP